MRYICSRCKREANGGGELVASVDSGGVGAARKFTAAICDDCFNSLIDWFRQAEKKPTTSPEAR